MFIVILLNGGIKDYGFEEERTTDFGGWNFIEYGFLRLECDLGFDLGILLFICNFEVSL